MNQPGRGDSPIPDRTENIGPYNECVTIMKKSNNPVNSFAVENDFDLHNEHSRPSTITSRPSKNSKSPKYKWNTI